MTTTATPQSTGAARSHLSRLFSRPARGAWPMIQRELRASSHHAITYWQRFITGAIAFLVLYSIPAVSALLQSQMGGYLFLGLHALLMVTLAIFAPFMTADCIAREKREGTLGLLFLTPLSSQGIVIGKSAAQTIRIFSIWLTTLPMLIIPFALGGVTWFDFCVAVTFEFAVAALGLAAGLISTTLFEDRNWAFFVAGALAACFWMFYAVYVGFLVNAASMQNPDFLLCMKSGLILVTAPGRPWESIQGTHIPRFWTYIFASSWAFSLLWLMISLLWAARHIEYTWRDKLDKRRSIWTRLAGALLDESPKPSKTRWLTNRRLLMGLFLALSGWVVAGISWQFDLSHPRLFFTSLELGWVFFVILAAMSVGKPRVLGPFLRHRKIGDNNPIGWLSTYSRKTRFSQAGLCLLFIMAGVACFYFKISNFFSMDTIENTMLIVFGAAYTLSGVSSFWREKQSGALELILITPVTVNQLIWGRVRGLWLQFLPSALVLVVFHLLSGERSSNGSRDEPILASILVFTYVGLPFFATYTALRVRYFIVACILTLLGALLAICFGSELASFTFYINGSTNAPVELVILCIALGFCLFIGLIFFLLRHSLYRRIYSF